MAKQILLVDDQESMRNLTKTMLTGEGYAVTEAENGLEGWKIFEKAPADFNLIVADVNMPVMDGFELLKKIKDEGHQIPIVLLTGVNENVVETVGSIYKADAIINKPYRVDEALAVIKKLI